MLDVRDLDSGYGRVPVLHGISLTVEPGEVVLVLGGNGAGKTTLMRTIAGFIKPTRGTVMLDGRDITGQSPETNARAGSASYPRRPSRVSRAERRPTISGSAPRFAAGGGDFEQLGRARCSTSFRSCAPSCVPPRAT